MALLVGTFGAIVSLGTAQAAQTVTVDAWIGDLKAIHPGGTNADAPLPFGAPHAHFTIPGPIGWFTSNGANLVNDFFTQDGGVGLRSITGFSCPRSTYGSITHDDGTGLYINNGTITVFNHAPETSAVTDSAILPAGSHNFDLYPVEGNRAPSVLKISFPDDVQVLESGSLALLSAGPWSASA